MTKPEAISILRQLADAVVDVVRATPGGVPGGVLYATMMTHGCTLDQFEVLMGALVQAKRLRRSGQLYFAT